MNNAWAGGLNAPIFSQIDLNGDGKKDLFIFDKDGSRITTYINNGTPNNIDYHYAPEYRSKFPKGLHDWVLLYDFNCDGCCLVSDSIQMCDFMSREERSEPDAWNPETVKYHDKYINRVRDDLIERWNTREGI